MHDRQSYLRTEVYADFFLLKYRCRTCRKRKTRCDGGRPVCSKCMEKGHECLGYAEGGEGKKETKGSDTNRNADDDNDENDEDSKSVDSQAGNGYKSSAYGSTDLRRIDTPSYFDNAPKVQGDMADTKREGTTGFSVHYTDTAVFSGREPCPLGETFQYSDATSEKIAQPPGRPTSLHVQSHRVPYFRYFGPTAIVPGFKQMVVSVREHRPSMGTGSSATSRFSNSRFLFEANSHKQRLRYLQVILAEEDLVEPLLKPGRTHVQLSKYLSTIRLIHYPCIG